MAEFDDLSSRTRKALQMVGVDSISSLVSLTRQEILQVKGIGSTAFEECCNLISEKGLMFRVDAPEFRLTQLNVEELKQAVSCRKFSKEINLEVGERLGIGRQVAYELGRWLLLALEMNEDAHIQNERWVAQCRNLIK